MTEFIDETKETHNKGKTEFKLSLTTSNELVEASPPNSFEIVKLIRRKDANYEYDLMVAYAKGREHEFEYWVLGHWNEGK